MARHPWPNSWSVQGPHRMANWKAPLHSTSPSQTLRHTLFCYVFVTNPWCEIKMAGFKAAALLLAVLLSASTMGEPPTVLAHLFFHPACAQHIHDEAGSIDGRQGWGGWWERLRCLYARRSGLCINPPPSIPYPSPSHLRPNPPLQALLPFLTGGCLMGQAPPAPLLPQAPAQPPARAPLLLPRCPLSSRCLLCSPPIPSLPGFWPTRR